MRKTLLLLSITCTPIVASAQWGVGLGAFANSFNQSYSAQSQAAAAQAQAEAQLAAIRQMRMQQREQYGTKEIKRLDQQDALADQKLALIIERVYQKNTEAK